MRRMLAALFLLTTATVVVQAGDDEAAILGLHTQEREGHLRGNADLVVAALASHMPPERRCHQLWRPTRDAFQFHACVL
jgi:hypothetical protein